MDLAQLKAAILRLLKEDEEFRYAVAGLIGMEEVLRRLDRHGGELVRLREDMSRGFQRYDQLFAEVFMKLEEYGQLFAELLRRLDRHWEESARFRAGVESALDRFQRHLDALGVMCGLVSEEAFRDGLRGVVEKVFGFKLEKWEAHDKEGKVFGYSTDVEVDVAVKDGRVILVELLPRARMSDVAVFKRKAELYAEKEGRRPDRLIIVTPYVDEKAVRLAARLGIELYIEV